MPEENLAAVLHIATPTFTENNGKLVTNSK
jgi:hypothetical protein